jgi:CHAT domain-containing protein/tetratricopeptide (TPR) repeat protein
VGASIFAHNRAAVPTPEALFEDGFLHAAEEVADRTLLARIYARQGRGPELTQLASSIARPPRSSTAWRVVLFADTTAAIATGKVDEAMHLCVVAREWSLRNGDPTLGALAMQLFAAAADEKLSLEPNCTDPPLHLDNLYLGAAGGSTQAGDTDGELTMLRQYLRVTANEKTWSQMVAGVEYVRSRASKHRRQAALLEALVASLAVSRYINGEITETERDADASRALAMAEAVSPFVLAEAIHELWSDYHHAGLPPPAPLERAAAIFREENALHDLFLAEVAISRDLLRRDPSDALQHAREAADLARRMADPRAEHLALHLIGDIHQRQGDFGAAIAIGEKTLKLPVPPMSRGSMLTFLALAARWRQDLDASERYAHEAIGILRPLGATPQLMTALSHRALAIMDQKPDEAIGLWREGIHLSRMIDDRGAEASALTNIATTIARRGDQKSLAEAREALRGARELAMSLGAARSPDQLLAIDIAEARIDGLTGDHEREMRKQEEIAHAMESLGAPIEAVIVRFGNFLRKSQILGDAIPHELLAEGESLLRVLDQSDTLTLRAETALFLGIAYLRTSTGLQRARELFDLAMRDIDLSRVRTISTTAAEAMAGQIGMHAQTSAMLSFIVSSWIESGEPVAAFETLERMKARVLTDAFSFAPLRKPASLSETVLNREEALLRERAAAEDIDRRRAAASDLQSLWQEMALHPDAREYVDVRRGTTMNWQEARALLAVEERLLGGDRRIVAVSYFVTNKLLRALVLRSGDETPQIAAIQLREDELQSFASRVHASLGKAVDDADVAEALSMLVAIAGTTARPHDLVLFVPAGAIHGLPLHAAKLDGRPLIERNPVAFLPNLSALRAARLQRGPGDNVRLTVIGNPRGDLDGAEREAKAIAHGRPSTTLLLREQATHAAVAEALATSDAIHYAGHAFFDASDPLASGLRLAAGTTLTARDVLQLPHARARFVMLSGCETGVARHMQGDELLGLQRAFAYQGTTALGITLWRVVDAAAVFLMKRFYAEREARCAADALREAMIAAIAKYGVDRPTLWAPYILYGDWQTDTGASEAC